MLARRTVAFAAEISPHPGPRVLVLIVASYLSQTQIYSFRRLRRVAFLPVVFLPFFFSMRRRVDALRPGWTFPRRVRRRPPSIPPTVRGESPGILFTTPENLRRRQGSDVPRPSVSMAVGPDVRVGWRDRVVRPTPAHLEATHQGRLTTRGLHALLLQHATEGRGLEGATRATAAGHYWYVVMRTAVASLSVRGHHDGPASCLTLVS